MEGDERSAMRSGEDGTTVEGDIQGRIKDNKGGGLHWCFGIKDDGIREAWMEKHGSQLSNIKFSTIDECNKSGLGHLQCPA